MNRVGTSDRDTRLCSSRLSQGADEGVGQRGGSAVCRCHRQRPPPDSGVARREGPDLRGTDRVGVIMVQPFIGGAPLDLPGMFCVVAFAVAIPLLAALVLLNRREVFRSRLAHSRLVAVGQALAQGARSWAS